MRLKYLSISPSPKVTVNSEVLFSKPVILKKSFVGIGQECDYSFNFALNPGVTVTSAGRILILFTHQAPARLNNEGVPRCSVNQVSAVCTFLEDYFLSIQISTNLLTTPSAPSGSTVQPVAVMNEVLISGVKQGNFYTFLDGYNHLEFRNEDKIYFAVDSDSVSLHDYVKDPFIHSSVFSPPKKFNVQRVEVVNVDAQGRIKIIVHHNQKLSFQRLFRKFL